MSYKIDQYFEFGVQTSHPTTGAAADADATPAWRAYEENNDAVIASGDCAKRDDANTVGYYYARGQITTSAGYEVGKKYIVRVAATVNSVAGAGVVGEFAVIPAQVWDSLHGGIDLLDTEISALATAADLALVKAKTDNIPASPAAVGSAMTLTSTYDAAKTAAPASTALSNATWTDAKAGYLDASIAGVAAAVWAVSTRTLSSFGTLVADVVDGVWSAAARTITGWTGGPTLANQEAILAAIGIGAGDPERTYTVYAPDGTTPVPGVKVDIYSSNADGDQLAFITSSTTDAWGVLAPKPRLAAGYYLMVASKAGYAQSTDLELFEDA